VGAVTAASPAAFQSTADIQLAAEIRTAWLEDKRVAQICDRVTPVVRDGVVVLQGKVDTAEEKRVIGADARAVPGVTRVDDLVNTRE
jgi:osmotically-inducible protein OsmY